MSEHDYCWQHNPGDPFCACQFPKLVTSWPYECCNCMRLLRPRELVMLNEGVKKAWMAERMAKGFSFQYRKANVPGATYSDGTPERDRNVEVICVETGESLQFLWG